MLYMWAGMLDAYREKDPPRRSVEEAARIQRAHAPKAAGGGSKRAQSLLELEEEQGLFEMDAGWDSDGDGDWESGSANARGGVRAGGGGSGLSPGLAASSMLFDDDDLRHP